MGAAEACRKLRGRHSYRLMEAEEGWGLALARAEAAVAVGGGRVSEIVGVAMGEEGEDGWEARRGGLTAAQGALLLALFFRA